MPMYSLTRDPELLRCYFRNVFRMFIDLLRVAESP